MDLASCFTLNNGVGIPTLGLGVFQAEPGEETHDAVLHALETGYRHIDTARVYRNEHAVGDALRESGVPRSEVFVTTKLWNGDHGFEKALTACDASLNRLGLDFIDANSEDPAARSRPSSRKAKTKPTKLAAV